MKYYFAAATATGMYTNVSKMLSKAGNTIFRIHKGLLQTRSKLFRTMFDSTSTALVEEGVTCETPILLPYATSEEFEHFLDYIYAQYVGS